MKQIGVFTKKIIDLLELDVAEGTPIFIGDSNIKHIKQRHPAEYDMYFSHIEEIIQYPDYVGIDQKNDSIDFVKVFQLGTEYVQVSVRVSASGQFFARTLFTLMSFKAERYIKQGTLIKIP